MKPKILSLFKKALSTYINKLFIISQKFNYPDAISAKAKLTSKGSSYKM